MNSSLIDRILPIYHGAPKKRHDLLCADLSNNSELSNVSVEAIDLCIQKIEELISISVKFAKDELYGQITRQDAIQNIKAASPDISETSLEILFERASHYARR